MASKLGVGEGLDSPAKIEVHVVEELDQGADQLIV
jgi:hypothetical protein